MPVLEPGEAVFFSQNTFDDALDIEEELKELTSPGDDEVDFTSEEREDLAQAVVDIMDAIDDGDFDPTSPEDRAAEMDTELPQPRDTAPKTPKTPNERLAEKEERLGFEGEGAPLDEGRREL